MFSYYFNKLKDTYNNISNKVNLIYNNIKSYIISTSINLFILAYFAYDFYYYTTLHHERKLNDIPHPIIKDIRLLYDRKQLVIDNNEYYDICNMQWNTIGDRYRNYIQDSNIKDYDECILNNNLIMHISYSYKGNIYRVILRQIKNENINILNHNEWLSKYPVYEILNLEIKNNTNNFNNNTKNILEIYAGPLCDYYKHIGLDMNEGYLDEKYEYIEPFEIHITDLLDITTIIYANEKYF